MRTTLVLLSIIITQAAFAQQLPVRLEPRHRNIFENEKVRILDVRFAPSDTTLYHEHRTPSVFLTLHAVATGGQLFGEKLSPESDKGPDGELSYDPLPTPRYHRVWNADTTWFHVQDIELIGLPTETVLKEWKGQGIETIALAPLANVYQLSAPNGKPIEIPASAGGTLLISMGKARVHLRSGANTQRLTMLPGHFQWIDGSTSITCLDADRFAVIQMK
jgi:hypothetical protein